MIEFCDDTHGKASLLVMLLYICKPLPLMHFGCWELGFQLT